MRGKYMKVFISWSGNTSWKVATVFREWLPSVIQSIEPYVSSEDIDKGARWSTDIAKELENSTFGILCVTKENLTAPWLSFEAGALSKTIEKSLVTPFLFDIKRSEVQGPILQFQSTIFQKEDIWKMVKTLNSACGSEGISEQRLEKAYEVWYPRLEKELAEIENKEETSPGENTYNNTAEQSTEILEEILELSRDNQKLLRNPDLTKNSLQEVKEYLERIPAIQNSPSYRTEKYQLDFLMEIIHKLPKDKREYGLLIALSPLREDFPWLYDMGKELASALKGKSGLDRLNVIQEFRSTIESVFSHPYIRELSNYSKNSVKLYRELPYVINTCLNEFKGYY